MVDPSKMEEHSFGGLVMTVSRDSGGQRPCTTYRTSAFVVQEPRPAEGPAFSLFKSCFEFSYITEMCSGMCKKKMTS